jgi:hypothetical protein
MAVSDHRPEAQERRCRNVDAELREIALEKTLNELAPPGDAIFSG